MTISELILELSLLLEREGDIQVYVIDNDEVEGRPLLAVCDEAPRKWVLL